MLLRIAQHLNVQDSGVESGRWVGDGGDHFEIGSSPVCEVSHVDDVGLVSMAPCPFVAVRRADGYLTVLRHTFGLSRFQVDRGNCEPSWQTSCGGFGTCLTKKRWEECFWLVACATRICLQTRWYQIICGWFAMWTEEITARARVSSKRWKESKECPRTDVVHCQSTGWSGYL